MIFKWKTYPIDNRYEVSSGGEVRHRRSKKLRRPYMMKNGYLALTFKIGKKYTHQLVHRMVAETFKGSGKNLEVSHLNGNRKDNRAINLLYETHQKNMQRMWGHKTDCTGERASFAILTWKKVNKIRALRGNLSATKIAKKYGISWSMVYRIWSNRAWREDRR